MKSFFLYFAFFFSLSANAQAVWQAWDNCFSVSIRDTVTGKKYTYAKNQLQVYQSASQLQLQRANDPIIIAIWDDSTVLEIAPTLSQGYDLLSGWLVNTCTVTSGGAGNNCLWTDTVSGGVHYLMPKSLFSTDTSDIFSVLLSSQTDSVYIQFFSGDEISRGFIIAGGLKVDSTVDYVLGVVDSETVVYTPYTKTQTFYDSIYFEPLNPVGDSVLINTGSNVGVYKGVLTGDIFTVSGNFGVNVNNDSTQNVHFYIPLPYPATLTEFSQASGVISGQLGHAGIITVPFDTGVTNKVEGIINLKQFGIPDSEYFSYSFSYKISP